MGACRPCPDHATSLPNSSSERQCACDAGYYNEQPSRANTVSCAPCTAGAACPAMSGVTLEHLPLKRGYYRTSTSSSDLRRCPDFGNSSGCIGGWVDGEGPCASWLRGPYCRLCNVTDTSRYYDATRSACVPCEGGVEAPLAIAISVIVAVAAVVAVWAWRKPHRTVPAIARLGGWAWRLFAQLALRAKLKQMLSFYQVATRISDVYVIPMPEAVERLLSVFELLNINIGGIGLPLQCLGLGTYEQQLATTMLLPAPVSYTHLTLPTILLV